MIIDCAKIYGVLSVDLVRNGAIVESHLFKNLVVNAGLEYIAKKIIGGTDPVMSHMAVGSGLTPVNASDISLENESAIQGFSSVSQNGAEIVYKAIFGVGVGSGVISEAGIFNADTDGVMLCRTVFSPIQKSQDDSMRIIWSISVAG